MDPKEVNESRDQIQSKSSTSDEHRYSLFIEADLDKDDDNPVHEYTGGKRGNGNPGMLFQCLNIYYGVFLMTFKFHKKCVYLMFKYFI